MNANPMFAPHLAANAGQAEFLTVNMVMPAPDDTAEGSAGFGRLLLALSALALERFGSAQENPCPDAPRECVPSCWAGTPLDPFDGRLLRFSEADGGYQLHRTNHRLINAPVAKGDRTLAVPGSP
jgi:hypothetical protein